MLNTIKKAVFGSFGEKEKKGFFLTGYDLNGNIIFSNGVVDTDKTLKEITDDIYFNFAEKYKDNIKILLCDVVTNVLEVSDPKDILSKSPKDYGFVINQKNTEKSGVMLPSTEGVVDAKGALFNIKQKYKLDGQVKITVFRTERIQIDF